jgi:hypothetical protein
MFDAQSEKDLPSTLAASIQIQITGSGAYADFCRMHVFLLDGQLRTEITDADSRQTPRQNVAHARRSAVGARERG